MPLPHSMDPFTFLAVLRTSWAASDAVRQCADRPACWQQKPTAVLPRLHLNAYYAVVHSSHGKSSSWLLFMFTNSLIRACRRSEEGREQKKNGLQPTDELSLSSLLLLSLLFFCFIFFLSFLFLRVPGMPPIFLCSNYCLSKLCQRAEIVLMRGPAGFASVIWWVSLGTHKTRHTRAYVTTLEPRVGRVYF